MKPRMMISFLVFSLMLILKDCCAEGVPQFDAPPQDHVCCGPCLSSSAAAHRDNPECDARLCANIFGTCSIAAGGEEGQHQHSSGDDRRRLQYNTIPAGGWSDYTVQGATNGLEYLWASKVAPTKNYYDAFPNDYGLTCHNDPDVGKWYNLDIIYYSTDNFPDCIRYSGFRLPTSKEAFERPLSEPQCMADYTEGPRLGCDSIDWTDVGFATQTGWVQTPKFIFDAVDGIYDGECNWAVDTVYVRPVGTADFCDPCGPVKADLTNCLVEAAQALSNTNLCEQEFKNYAAVCLDSVCLDITEAPTAGPTAGPTASSAAMGTTITTCDVPDNLCNVNDPSKGFVYCFQHKDHYHNKCFVDDAAAIAKDAYTNYDFVGCGCCEALVEVPRTRIKKSAKSNGAPSCPRAGSLRRRELLAAEDFPPQYPSEEERKTISSKRGRRGGE